MRWSTQSRAKKNVVLFILLFIVISPLFIQSCATGGGSDNGGGAGGEGGGVSPGSNSRASLSLNPTALNLGYVPSTQSSATSWISVQNGGDAAASGCAISLGDTVNFSLVNTSTCALLPVGTACSFGVVANPQGINNFSTFVTVSCDGGVSVSSPGGSIQVTSVSDASLQISPQILNFGDVLVGSSSPAREVTIQNVGGGLATSCSVTLDNTTDFELSGVNSCSQIPAAGSCTVALVAHPRSVGIASSALSIQCAGGVSKETASGAYVSQGLAPASPPSISVSPATYNFGTVAVGAFSSGVDFTFTNSGGTAGEGCYIDPLPADYLVVSNACGSSTNPVNIARDSGNCSVRVRAQPQSNPGTILASLVLRCSGDYSATSLLSTTSRATYVGPSITSYSSSLGTVAVGGTSSNTAYFRVQNYTGTSITGCSFSGSSGLSDAANFQVVSNNCGASIAPYSSCEIGVKGTPQTAGNFGTDFSFTCAQSGTYSSTGNPVTVTGASPQLYWTSLQQAPSSNTAAVDLGTFNQGSYVTKNIYVYNVGMVNGLNCHFNFTGADTDKFPSHVPNGNPSTIYSGSYANVYWTFGPVAAPGTYTETVNVSCDGGSSASIEVTYRSR